MSATSGSWGTPNSSPEPAQCLDSEQRAVLAEVVRRGLTLPNSTTDLGRYRTDPVSFAAIELGLKPWRLQRDIMQAVARNRRVAVRSCHNSGKTHAVAALTHWFARCFDPALVLTTAPTDRQMREVLWHEIATLQRKANLGGRLTETSLEVSETQRAFGFSTNTPERFQGWHEANILVIVDEASGVPEPIYEAIEGCLTGPNARLVLIGNPNSPQGTFYEAFRSPLFEKFHISAFDVPPRILPAGWAEERRQEWGEESPAYQVRVLGEFPDQGEDHLIRLSWVNDAQSRAPLVGSAMAGAEVVIGVDVARYGRDESVAIIRRGRDVVESIPWRGNDTMASAGRAAALGRQWGAVRINVDEVGLGAGVLDRLLEEGLPAYGVNVGEAAVDSERFANRRAEIFWGLRDRFKDGDISLPGDDPLLLDQLTSLKFTYTPKGQLKLESKEEIRKRRTASSRWQSPDRADALALCFAGEGKGYMPVAFAGPARSMR